MKSILCLLIVFISFSSYSQTWTTVAIDQNLSISLPERFDKSHTSDGSIFGASTLLCNLTVKRTTLPETSISDSIPTDYLQYYTKGFMAGQEFFGSVEILYSSDGVIENVKTRTLKMKRNGKVKDVFFMKVDDYIYVITLDEISSDSAVEIEKILASIQLK